MMSKQFKEDATRRFLNPSYPSNMDFEEERMCWIETHYPVGKEITAPHPSTEQEETATVISHTIEQAYGGGQRCAGIRVQFADGVRMELEAMCL